MSKLSQNIFPSVFIVIFCQKFLKVECLKYETGVKIRTNQYVVKGMCEMEGRACYTLKQVLKSVKKRSEKEQGEPREDG